MTLVASRDTVNNTFTARIGPTGGKRGYTPITGANIEKFISKKILKTDYLPVQEYGVIIDILYQNLENVAIDLIITIHS